MGGSGANWWVRPLAMIHPGGFRRFQMATRTAGDVSPLMAFSHLGQCTLEGRCLPRCLSVRDLSHPPSYAESTGRK